MKKMSSNFVNVSSSGSEADAQQDIMEEKKRKRMISNRESARRSRMKRQRHLESLVREKAALEKKLAEDNQKFIEIWQSHVVLESEKKVLEAENMRLDSYLKYLNQILVNYKDYRCVSEPYLNAWQIHGLGQPIATSGMLEI